MNASGLTWQTPAVTVDNPYRDLPSVDQLAAELEGRLPWPLVVDAVRTALQQSRRDIEEGKQVDARRMAENLVKTLERSDGTKVINATGVLLHTNLGRAVWSTQAIKQAGEVAANYTNVEIDIDTGRRARRGSYVSTLLKTLTGAEDALIVDNNAAAVVLALAATSAGKAVPVARGELIEIGGSYRLPDVMEASGSRLVEIGTTNRTRAGDYATALQLHNCGSILKVHPSNYRVEGFTEEASIDELAELALSRDIPLIYDIGSGLLDADTPWLDISTPTWLRAEPAARQSLAAGADLVTFSGDKLLGGPQAGIIVGTAPAVSLLRRHPLARALRVDAITYAALAATLGAFASRDVEQIPFWRQALMPSEGLAGRASAMADRLGGRVEEGQSTIGAGSVPGMTMPSPVVVLPEEDHLYELLLKADVPILTRRESGSLVMDLRTVDPVSDHLVMETVAQCR